MPLQAQLRRTFGALAQERGSITAEFAIVLPAVLMVLALALTALLLATQRLSLTSAAADIARLEARADSDTAAARLGELGSGVTIARSTQGVLHCVTLSASASTGAFEPLRVSARGCAALSVQQ